MPNLYKYETLDKDMVKKEFKVTPWEVSGKINYEKLINEFGISPIKDLPENFNKEIYFKRKLVFAHRDLQKILESIKNKKKFIVLSGLMPTGKFHLGHTLLINQMIFYQKLGAKIYIPIADVEAYNVRGQSLADSREIAIEEYIKNYIALGLSPENCEIYFQSDRSKDGEKACAYYRLQNLLAKNTTYNEYKAVYGDITPGKMMSSLLQSADILHPQLPEFENPCPILVPVGVDQDPHLRITRDISQRAKNNKFIQISSTYHFFIPGLKGVESKMSASDPTSYIALTDTPEDVKKKINKYAFSGGRDTLEEHRKLGGNPDIDVSFLYLKYLFEPNDEKLAQIEKDYRSGKLLSGELKKILIDKINIFLKEHQKKRESAKNIINKFIS
ncbi:tryptophan--tRNA ligase [Candidatus Pacearchaeota archaeon CG10_big_fil_rev_8_21_14_0_10_31_24]|nr:MAG: tryptophan--tRNA ligase [Candidatus Pacearchaeota archaeon CG10_big_fil_rev_8_21_14_0_10_31_24]